MERTTYGGPCIILGFDSVLINHGSKPGIGWAPIYSLYRDDIGSLVWRKNEQGMLAVDLETVNPRLGGPLSLIGPPPFGLASSCAL